MSDDFDSIDLGDVGADGGDVGVEVGDAVEVDTEPGDFGVVADVASFSGSEPDSNEGVADATDVTDTASADITSGPEIAVITDEHGQEVEIPAFIARSLESDSGQVTAGPVDQGPAVQEAEPAAAGTPVPADAHGGAEPKEPGEKGTLVLRPLGPGESRRPDRSIPSEPAGQERPTGTTKEPGPKEPESRATDGKGPQGKVQKQETTEEPKQPTTPRPSRLGELGRRFNDLRDRGRRVLDDLRKRLRPETKQKPERPGKQGEQKPTGKGGKQTPPGQRPTGKKEEQGPTPKDRRPSFGGLVRRLGNGLGRVGNVGRGLWGRVQRSFAPTRPKPQGQGPTGRQGGQRVPEPRRTSEPKGGQGGSGPRPTTAPKSGRSAGDIVRGLWGRVQRSFAPTRPKPQGQGPTGGQGGQKAPEPRRTSGPKGGQGGPAPKPTGPGPGGGKRLRLPSGIGSAISTLLGSGGRVTYALIALLVAVILALGVAGVGLVTAEQISLEISKPAKYLIILLVLIMVIFFR